MCCLSRALSALIWQSMTQGLNISYAGFVHCHCTGRLALLDITINIFILFHYYRRPLKWSSNFTFQVSLVWLFIILCLWLCILWITILHYHTGWGYRSLWISHHYHSLKLSNWLHFENIAIYLWHTMKHLMALDWPVSMPHVRRAKQNKARRPVGPLIGHKLHTGWQGRPQWP